MKPNRLITAPLLGRRNRRGRLFPFWGFGVIVPTSTDPKPCLRRVLTPRAFLSKPAASPTGLEKWRPKHVWERAATSAEGLLEPRPNSRALMARAWAISGGNRDSMNRVSFCFVIIIDYLSNLSELYFVFTYGQSIMIHLSGNFKNLIGA